MTDAYNITGTTREHVFDILLTNRDKEAIIPGESQTLHCSSVVGDGLMTSSGLDIPNANEASSAINAACC